jgi:hypothetical protein
MLGASATCFFVTYNNSYQLNKVNILSISLIYKYFSMIYHFLTMKSLTDSQVLIGKKNEIFNF